VSGSPRKESARRLALRTIRRVIENGAYSNLALAAELGRSGLSARDRQFAADLVYGTLRKKLILDRAIADVSSRPLDAIDPPVAATLRMGAYQVLFTRVPAYAAVSETVALAAPHERSFVNAILRKLAAGAPPAPRAAADDDESISSRTGLAAWAISELRRLLPADEIEAAATSLASPADLTLRTNTCITSTAALRRTLREAGVEVRQGRHHPDILQVSAAAPALLPGYERGWFSIQDEGSVLVVDALQVRGDERILDACAGPGGKAAHLACLVQPEGRTVGADVRPHRATLVRRTAARLRVPVQVLVQDARRPAVRPGFDAVLVDGPCSGLGAARRRPELLWRPAKEELARLARLQVAILAGASALVRPGGRLLYSVCTYPRAETDAAVRAFLSKAPQFEPAPVPGPDGPAPSHRLWPHRHGTDAMFFAGFRRTSEHLGTGSSGPWDDEARG
jgi:16S rRNA (cytosine967-C5)-methyltransferase